MTPKTIYRDESRIEGEMNTANHIISENLLPLSEALKSDGIQFDNQDEFIEFLQDTELANTDHESIIDKKIEAVVDEDLSKSKIKSNNVLKGLKEKAMQYDRWKYDKFRRDFMDTLRIYDLNASDFTFNNGKPGISISFKNRIEDKFTSVLTNEEELSLWNEVQALCESFNKIEDLRQQLGMDSFITKYLKDTDYLYIKTERLPTSGRIDYFKAIPKPEGFVRERELFI
jgi:hypothetical protein